MMGPLHGASVIMVILYVLFLLIFARLAWLSLKHERAKIAKKSSSPLYDSIECRILRRLIKCCTWFKCCSTSKSKAEAADTAEANAPEDLKAEATADTNGESPDREEKQTLLESCLVRLGIKKHHSLPQEESPVDVDSPSTEGKPSKAGLPFGKLNFLDKMRFVGEKLERFIQERFWYLGKFCAEYPKLVLFLGLAFCALMCLGYFNFEIEKDPIKLWSADTSIARKNKKYFDENFGPFYRITQLIIEPKPHVKGLIYQKTEENVYNITALQPDILYEVYK